MSNEPDRVELLEAGKVVASLNDSSRRVQDDFPKYSGRADTARIFGPAGSAVVFFDDQQFRTGENALIIKKKVDEPVEVAISQDFIKDGQERGNGVFQEETPEYRWMLLKSVQAGWLDDVPIDWESLERKAEQSGGVWEFLHNVKVMFLGDRKSSNYRVDNCSSVRFGE